MPIAELESKLAADDAHAKLVVDLYHRLVKADAKSAAAALKQFGGKAKAVLDANVALAGTWLLYDDEEGGDLHGELKLDGQLAITHLSWDDSTVPRWGSIRPSEDIASNTSAFTYTTDMSVCNCDVDVEVEICAASSALLSVQIDACGPGDDYDPGENLGGEFYARREEIQSSKKRPVAPGGDSEGKKAKK